MLFYMVFAGDTPFSSWFILNLKIYLIFYFIFPFLLMCNYSWPHFIPITVPCPTHPYLPPSILSPPCLCPWVLPFFAPLSPSSSPLVTVSLFFISMSLVIFYILNNYFFYHSIIAMLIWSQKEHIIIQTIYFIFYLLSSPMRWVNSTGIVLCQFHRSKSSKSRSAKWLIQRHIGNQRTEVRNFVFNLSTPFFSYNFLSIFIELRFVCTLSSSKFRVFYQILS